MANSVSLAQNMVYCLGTVFASLHLIWLLCFVLLVFADIVPSHGATLDPDFADCIVFVGGWAVVLGTFVIPILLQKYQSSTVTRYFYCFIFCATAQASLLISFAKLLHWHWNPPQYVSGQCSPLEQTLCRDQAVYYWIRYSLHALGVGLFMISGALILLCYPNKTTTFTNSSNPSTYSVAAGCRRSLRTDHSLLMPKGSRPVMKYYAPSNEKFFEYV